MPAISKDCRMSLSCARNSCGLWTWTKLSIASDNFAACSRIPIGVNCGRLTMFITRLLFKPLVRIIFTVGFVLLLSRPGWPTTLELRTGQVVTGTVISKDEDSYKIDTGIGFPVTYFIDEIKAIDGEPVSPPAPDVQEDEALPEPAEIKSEDTDISPQPQQPAGDELENVIEAEPAPTPMSPENTETETEAAGIAPDEEIQDTVQLEDFVIEETEPAEKARPMA